MMKTLLPAIDAELEIHADVAIFLGLELRREERRGRILRRDDEQLGPLDVERRDKGGWV